MSITVREWIEKFNNGEFDSSLSVSGTTLRENA